MREAAIQIEQVSKSIQERKVLKNISCELNWGQVYGIVGNNGSGKTVLMKCICGLLPYDEGSIRVNGKKIGKDVDFPEDMGMIIESPGFLPGMTGIKNLKILAAVNHRIQESQIRETMRVVGLDPNLKQPVGKYSLGMRQRLGIAQAIMEKPEILILDEPMNGLDKHGVKEIREVLLQMKEENRVILLSSHNPKDIDYLCDVVFEMDGGYLQEMNDAKEDK